MSLEAGEQRLQELSRVVSRLNHAENEPPGVCIEKAIEASECQFPPKEYTLPNLLNVLEASTDTPLTEDAGCGVDKELLATALRSSLSIIHRAERSFGPHLILWSKYLYNSIRFNGLSLEIENLSETEYIEVLKSSKEAAQAAGWSEIEALRVFYECFYNAGWYYYQEYELYYPKPIGANDLDLYQLVSQHFLLSLPHSFTLTELHKLLLEEVGELKHEMSQKKRNSLRVAFEATDVFIYLTHIASKQGFKLSELLMGKVSETLH
jgi:hypothetical protein